MASAAAATSFFMEASREAERINWGEWTWFDEYRAVDYVNVSCGAGCVTTTPVTGFAAGNGVLPFFQLADLDHVTR